ncbi:hypothetical protein [Yoonia sp. 208BN28-4]|uniref:hypothetical protein n=1 Tax=Yoonia sp. 208BN28-4 TaxID=3126505 RepID=UPI0030B776C0
MSVLNTMRIAAEKHAAYLRTKREIANMPLDVALDLGMYREDAGKIAYKAVYG